MGSRWIRWIGPGVVALGAVVLAAATTSGARERGWEPPPCRIRPAAAVDATAHGAWYRLDPVLEAGRLTGQRLAIGVAGTGRPRTLVLPPESFAAGPFGTTVLVGADDGARSTVRLIDAVTGCAWPALSSGDVVRRATLTPDGRALITFGVAREDRADLGVDIGGLGGADAPRRLLPPIEPDARFGATWSTEFAWELGGDRLAVQSCGAVACRTRVVDVGSGAVVMLDAPGVGDMIGFADGVVVAHGACGGLPCPILRIDASGPDVAAADILAGAAGQAALVRGVDGRALVAIEPEPGAGAVEMMDLDGRRAGSLAADGRGRRLVPGPARSGTAAIAPPGAVLVAPDGRLPLDGPIPAAVRRLVDGLTLPFEEIAR